MTTVDDLAAWLTQVWDEDEASASSVHDLDCDLTTNGKVDPRWGWKCTCDVPAEVLARIAADRQILALGICAACDVEEQPCDHRESTLRLLALPHADRPGYREEWKP